MVQNNRKRGQDKEYRDSSDSLPFCIQVTTPDPYARNPQPKEKRQKSKRGVEQTVSASYTTLGEFELDRHTTTGDLLNGVGGDGDDTQYRVVRLKCQYRYSGGGRFVMVRKILQVKEVGRFETEEKLLRQWKQSGSSDNDDAVHDVDASKD
jgi:hypothetical protein